MFTTVAIKTKTGAQVVNDAHSVPPLLYYSPTSPELDDTPHRLTSRGQTRVTEQRFFGQAGARPIGFLSGD